MKIPKYIADKIFADMRKGEMPKIGKPVTKCEDCSFCGEQCLKSREVNVVGCLGGWKF